MCDPVLRCRSRHTPTRGAASRKEHGSPRSILDPRCLIQEITFCLLSPALPVLPLQGTAV